MTVTEAINEAARVLREAEKLADRNPLAAERLNDTANTWLRLAQDLRYAEAYADE